MQSLRFATVHGRCKDIGLVDLPTLSNCMLFLFIFVLTVQATLSSTLQCPQSMEGHCREGPTRATVDICASGVWQRIDTALYTCIAGQLVPRPIEDVVVPIKSSPSTHVPPATATRSLPIPVTDAIVPASLANTTGNAYCSGIRLQQRHDAWGRASYRPGGKMASTYDATPESAFRCDRAPPPNGYYVAFWTRYQAAQTSQPAPMNCNRTLTVTNPWLRRTASATVIDRCASCVGVGRQLDDPTTPDCLVNGATVDLSRDLWHFLFNGAPPNVYDVEYDEDVYAGWTTDPPSLTAMSAAQCNCG